jgi:hypothetical protein
VYSGISLPMTGAGTPLSFPFMTKPGRRAATPMEFKAALAHRVRDAREGVQLDFRRMADLLSDRMGRPISPDTYRKWETTESMIPHDAIAAFCDITHTHPFALLANTTDLQILEPVSKLRRVK